MPPRNTGPINASTLLFLVVIAVLAFLLYRFSAQKPTPRHETRRSREYPRREQHPREAENCQAFGLTCRSTYFARWQPPAGRSCRTRFVNGNLQPDPRCTPGGINLSVTPETLRDPAWRTRCLRNCESSEAEKHIAYSWYAIRKPQHNSEQNQVCELDHLVPLELGGADGLGNIWPECGPADAALRDRNFKIKDRVENYLADQVRAGRMPLAVAQRGIARDWSRYLPDADRYCAAGGRC